MLCSECVNVNLEYPERNWPVEIVPFNDVEFGDKLHNGYIITMMAEPEFCILEDYSATLISKNEILLDIPAVSYAFMRHHQLIDRQDPCPSAIKGRLVTRNSLLQDESRWKRKVKLVFPTSIELSNTVYADPGTSIAGVENNVLKIGSTFGPQTSNVHGTNTFSLVCRVYWKITVVEERAQCINIIQKKAIGSRMQIEQMMRGKLYFCYIFLILTF